MTGANYLLEIADSSAVGGVRKIIIDCGLTQGSHFVEEHNYDAFNYKVEEISEVFVTHAHIDHTGRLPKLIKDGFTGVVYSTPPTRDFAELLLLDSEHILGQEAERAGHAPIYSEADIAGLMKRWKVAAYHQKIELSPAITVTMYSAGHILGSASVVIEAEGKKIVFSGDLGNQPAPFIGPAECPVDADYCVMESAYGNRIHENLSTRHQKLEQVIVDTMKDGGALMIPAFALERTQVLLLELKDMLAKHEIPNVPIFIDSPLAIKLTSVYNQYRNYFKPEIAAQYEDVTEIFRFPGMHMTTTSDDSKAINSVPNPKIIIAGSGMSHAGRILHHERRYLPDPKSTLLIFGYQAEGSMGRLLLNGVKHVRIMGEEVPVRAKIKALGAYSAHADQRQLLDWLKPLAGHVKKVFLVQGEGDAAGALARKIGEELHLDASVPTEGESVVL